MSERNPVLDLIAERVKSGSKPWNREDGFKIGLVTQGGCMRGVRLGGMHVASQALRLTTAIDGYYGDSASAAGTAYLVSGQTPEGTSIFYDHLPENFVDFRRPLKGQPVVDIPWMAYEVFGERVPLRWQAIAESPVPYHFYVSSSDRGQAKIVDLHKFKDKQDVLDAVHWTCRMPIIAGWPIEVRPGVFYTDGGVLTGTAPIQQAIEDGCTHILVYLTRSDAHLEKVTSLDKIVSRVLGKRYPGLGAGYLEGFTKYKQALGLIESRRDQTNLPFIQALRFNGSNTHVGRIEMRREILVQGALEGYQLVMNAFNRYNLPVDSEVQVLR